MGDSQGSALDYRATIPICIYINIVIIFRVCGLYLRHTNVCRFYAKVDEQHMRFDVVEQPQKTKEKKKRARTVKVAIETNW